MSKNKDILLDALLESEDYQPARIVNNIFRKKIANLVPELQHLSRQQQHLAKLCIGAGVLAVVKAIDSYPDNAQFSIPELLNRLDESLKDDETSQTVDEDDTPS